MTTLEEILSRYGVSTQNLEEIEPRLDDQGLRRIKFGAIGNPSIMMDFGGAIRLSAELHRAGERGVAIMIDEAVEKSKRLFPI